MTENTRIPALAAAGRDGLALIGRTVHDLRGIRFDEGEDGAKPAVPAAAAGAEQSAGAEAAAAGAAAASSLESVEGEEQLGDAGKKALDAMKAKWKAAEQDARDKAAALAALQAKVDGKEQEHTAELAAQKVRDEALAAANDRIKKAEVRAAAAKKLADPADALRYLDLSSFEVSEDGVVDGDVIAQAIDDLITQKPYLAAQGQRFGGGADGGARNAAAGKPKQMTEAEVKALYAAGKHAEIVQAKAEGRLDDYLGS